MTFALNPIGPIAQPDPGGDVKVAAKKLEAYFVRHLLAQVRKSSSGGLLGGGFSSKMFREMMDETLADTMAEAGGLGISRVITPQLSKSAAAGAYSNSASALSVDPVGGKVVSGFGWRITPRTKVRKFHQGVDIPARMGAPVRAAAPGVVVRANEFGGYGNVVIVDHGGGLQTRYAHLSAFDVQKGDRVGAGQLIGKIGSTGNSVGPHLHLEVRRNGQAIDPVSELPLQKLKGRSIRGLGGNHAH